jgi:hypothetical protein
VLGIPYISSILLNFLFICAAAPTSVVVKEFRDSSGAPQIPAAIAAAAAADNAVTAAAGTELELECIARGGNPAPRLTWFVGGVEIAGTVAQEDRRVGRTWSSRSRLRLPVSRADHGGQVRCEADHDALDTPLLARVSLNILYPPRVTASSTILTPSNSSSFSNASVLVEGGSVTLHCEVESNPAANRVIWRRSGSAATAAAILTSQPTFTMSPVSRETAGSYECVAENLLGLSEPAALQLNVECKFIIFIIFLLVFTLLKLLKTAVSFFCILKKSVSKNLDI